MSDLPSFETEEQACVWMCKTLGEDADTATNYRFAFLKDDVEGSMAYLKSVDEAHDDGYTNFDRIIVVQGRAAAIGCSYTPVVDPHTPSSPKA